MVDWIEFWRYIALVMAWIVVLIFIISSLEDIIYDIGLLIWKIVKRVKFKSRPRVNLQKLQSRVQQRIAIFIPAWDESNVIGMMLENLIKTVEYKNFSIFVGAYPNDEKTIKAIDQTATKHPNIIRVVNGHPGPTTKADCLNIIFNGMVAYEQANDTNFDIIVMHDAEDVVHPYSLLLYNYLLPRIDAVQLPILPLPVSHSKVVHWTYADEFAENHMKDMVVREHIKGLVPFAGVGTGFSRRAFLLIQEEGLTDIFNTTTLTEDYNFSKKLNDLKLKSIFVNVVLDDQKKSMLTPLVQRKDFIANWSYFPLTFRRAVRQKTRWVLGIALQEWELSGWHGDFFVKLTLFKDRKTFITLIAALLAYLVLAYIVVYELGARGYIELKLAPIIYKGTLLYLLVLIATGFMLFRMLERLLFVSMIYGLAAGLLSLPRIIFINILNGIATINALFQYLLAWRQKKKVAWDKTEHLEGVGQMPSNFGQPGAVSKLKKSFSLVALEKSIETAEPALIIAEVEAIPRDINESEREQIMKAITRLATWEDYTVRAGVARVGGYLRWDEYYPLLLDLLYDQEWVVRSNAARSLLSYPDINIRTTIEEVFKRKDRYAWDIFIKTIEQYTPIHDEIMKIINSSDFESSESFKMFLAHSTLFKKRSPVTINR